MRLGWRLSELHGGSVSTSVVGLGFWMGLIINVFMLVMDPLPVHSKYSDYFDITLGPENVRSVNDGRSWQLLLDQSTGKLAQCP